MIYKTWGFGSIRKIKEDKPITGIIPVTTVPCHEKTEKCI